MTLTIDTETEFGRRVAARLESDRIGWLVTVSPAGAPVPSPIWFLWDGSDLLIYSQPGTPKLRNIAANPQVAVHLDGDGEGGDIVVLSGTARVSDDPPASHVPDYVAKYAELIAAYEWTPDSFAADYAVPVRVTATRLRGS
ncbi:MAG TPA: TIGR03667 family PPOX class F420-dependent oxidoreductase [Gaiellales bacterium]|nr:TIGR03667 family PPOX class F420-dependent oxidoreductase [Gaiellales bacterium]